MSKIPTLASASPKRLLTESQAKSPDSTPSDTGKLATPVATITTSPAKTSDGATPPKSPGVSSAAKSTPEKAFTVTEVYFSQAVRVPGYHGAHTSAKVGVDQGYGTNILWVKSLVVVSDKLCINGNYWMPIASGLVAGWIY